jgi:CBS domain-containing protein
MMLTAKEIMTQDVVTVTEDTSVTEVARIFLEKGFNGLPVISETGEVLGVVTNSDLVDQNKRLHIPTVIALFDAVIYRDKQFKKELEKMTGSLVKDIYTRNPIIASPDTPLEELATIMAEKHVHTLPVVENGKLVGVVGKLDIIRSMVS